MDIIPPGQPFHGEFASGDASAPALETDARIKLYKEGTATEITALGINDQVIITDYNSQLASTVTVSMFFGATKAVTAGNLVHKVGHAASGQSQISVSFSTPYKGPVGAGGIPWPKILTSAAGQVDVQIRGTIVRVGS